MTFSDSTSAPNPRTRLPDLPLLPLAFATTSLTQPPTTSPKPRPTFYPIEDGGFLSPYLPGMHSVDGSGSGSGGSSDGSGSSGSGVSGGSGIKRGGGEGRVESRENLGGKKKSSSSPFGGLKPEVASLPHLRPEDFKPCTAAADGLLQFLPDSRGQHRLYICFGGKWLLRESLPTGNPRNATRTSQHRETDDKRNSG